MTYLVITPDTLREPSREEQRNPTCESRAHEYCRDAGRGDYIGLFDTDGGPSFFIANPKVPQGTDAGKLRWNDFQKKWLGSAQRIHEGN